MTIQIEPELATELRDAAQKTGQEIDIYVHAALLRQIVADKSRMSDDDFDAEMQAAANDPLFLEDSDEIEQAFASSDAETARMLDNA